MALLKVIIRDHKRPSVMESERDECNPPRTFGKGDDPKPSEETNPGIETSLRHYFYLEYRKTLPG